MNEGNTFIDPNLANPDVNPNLPHYKKVGSEENLGEVESPLQKPEEILNPVSAETPPEKIEFAEGKNGVLNEGANVNWDKGSGIVGTGKIVSFEKKESSKEIFAHIDVGPNDPQVEISASELSLVEDNAPAEPEQIDEEFNKAKELAREVLGAKAVQWYVKQNKRVRLGLVTALAGTVRLFTGGLAVGGIMAGNRIRRGIASFAGAGATNFGLQKIKALSTEELNKPEISDATEAPEAENSGAQEVVATTGKVAEGVFDNPEVVKVEVVGGDSTWKIVERMMEQSGKFKGLSGSTEEILAKKTFVISNLANEAIKNAEKIGLGPDGSLKIGDKLDFSNLFADKPKVDELMEKAQSLSTDKVKNILENNAKIAKWVTDPENTSKPLTSDQVSEILSQKVDSPKVATPTPSEMNYDDAETKEEVVPGKADTSKDENLAGLRSMSGDSVDALNKVNKPNLSGEAAFLPAVEETFKNEFDKIYADNGWLKKTPGMNTPEGRFMASQNWQDLLKYSKGDLQNSGLSPQLIKIIESSPKHLKFLEAVKMLNQETADQGVLVALQPNVKVPEAMKKIVTAIMKNESTQSA